MSRLNKTEKYAIQWLHSQGKSPAKIVTELGLSLEDVNATIEKTNPGGTNNSIKTKTSSASSKSKNLMITQTSAKKTNNVAIMTKEASEYNDSVKRNAKPSNPNTQKAIFKPKQ